MRAPHGNVSLPPVGITSVHAADPVKDADKKEEPEVKEEIVTPKPLQTKEARPWLLFLGGPAVMLREQSALFS